MIEILKLLPIGLVYGYIFLIGICLGSFLNVVILRGLSGEGIVFGRSHCPECNNNLKWYMNIPILSYLFLRGKCAFCKCHISYQYPVVEFLNGLAYLFAFYIFGFTLKSVLICAVLSLFIVLSAEDILETVIIDYHACILFVLCLLTAKLSGFDIVSAFFSSFLIFIIFEYLSLFTTALIGVRCFGFGDSLILLGIAALFDLKSTILLIFLSFIVQIIFSLVSVLRAKNYRLFGVMISALAVLLTDFILFYLKSPLCNTAFYVSLIALFVILILSINDIKNKTALSESGIKNNEKENQAASKGFIHTILKAVFVFVFLFINLFKTDKKQASFAYLFYIPVLFYLGVYVYILKQHTVIQNVFMMLSIAVLIFFITVISNNEQNAREVIIKDMSVEIETSLDFENSNYSNQYEFPFTVLPFGPALIITSVFGIFYIDKIQTIIKTVYENYLFIILSN